MFTLRSRETQTDREIDRDGEKKIMNKKEMYVLSRFGKFVLIIGWAVYISRYMYGFQEVDFYMWMGV